MASKRSPPKRQRQLRLDGTLVPKTKKAKVDNKKGKEVKIADVTLNLDYRPNFLPSPLLERLTSCLFSPDFKWLTDEESMVFVFGEWRTVPRKQQAFSFDGAKLAYNFSGANVAASPAERFPVLIELRDYVYQETGDHYNFVFLNLYRNGTDCIGYHRDDEDAMETGSPIASLSLGQSRDFVLRKYKEKSVRHVVHLSNNDLCVMRFPTNRDWEHSVPKRALSTAPDPRINLTFRKFKLREQVEEDL